ncbi:hypothetical protein [Chamaesiphon minutus]|uniref:Glycosyltransferase RgtA/B/C/D-like domain-containing protein n=1 Tax=Chamaesiphon minutus (strain ATCC 27169 / PCC 6605) TaxID=1173020 RepID=K9UGE3_CHAP6|nr:hypothetical protein [Chamaesiphon minutus]AFY93875.1 hypothetical protein Cha6605_2839 [Chamaesiphon minutus PCC 6605]
MSLRQDRLKARAIEIPEIAIFPLLVAIVWVAHFWHSASFGLYEDDWNRIPNIIGLSWQQIFTKVIFETSGQGRPFHDGLIFLFSFLGIKIGGLQYAYAIGAAIVSANACLFYSLLNKIYSNRVFAITGALTFCLFPADTTRDYLTHSLGIQPSLTFLLLALHCYTSGKIKLAYSIVFLSLITYEPVFTVFFAAPLFDREWNSKLPKILFRNAVILLGLIILILIVRRILGEGQVSQFGIQSIVLLILNPIIGSITSLTMLVYRPLETLLKFNTEWLLCLLAFISLACLFYYLKSESLHKVFSLRGLVRSKRFLKMPDALKPYAKPMLTGLAALMLAYPLAMTSYGFAISGRTTRVHVAAIIGTSILSACICSAILVTASRYNRRRLAALGLAGFFALLVGFGLRVQQDYQLMWQHQRGFWSDVVRLCPDLTEGTVIFVEPSGLRDTRQPVPFRPSRGVSDPKQIKALEWELPQVLSNIYQFPASWQLKPKAYRLQSDWQDKILSDRNLFRVSTAIPVINEDEMNREIESTNVIFLETKSDKLTRRTEPLTIGNRQFKLKQQTRAGLPPFEKKYLYNYLIQSPGDRSIDYLVGNSTSTSKKTS